MVGVGWTTCSGSSSGTPLVVQDEGVSVDVNVGTLNFTGSGVIASSGPAGTVTVNIPGASAATLQTAYNASTPANITINNVNGPVAIRNSMVSLPIILDIQTQTGASVFSVGNAGVTITGKLDVTGGIDPTYMAFSEQAANPWGPVVGQGALWVKNDSPNRLIFTDDTGTDFPLAGAGLSMATKQQEVTVAKTGGMFTSIASALASITDASSIKPYTIRVAPGVYTEPPLTMKQYVSISGEGCKSTIVQAANNSTVLFSLVNDSCLQDIAIIGPSGSIACRAASTAGARLQNIDFVSGSVGAQATGAGAQLMVENSKFQSGVTIGLEAGTGARIDGNSCLLQTTSIATYANGGIIWLHNSGCLGSTYALRALSGGSLYPHNFTAEGCTYSITCDGVGSLIQGTAIIARSTTSYDIMQTNSGRIDISSARLNPEKFFVTDWGKVNVLFDSEREDNEAFIVTKDFYIGRAEHGTQTRFGQGETTTRGLLVYTEDSSSGIFVNVTPAAISPSGSQFVVPTNINSALYVSTDIVTSAGIPIKFFGIRQYLNSPAVIPSGTTIVAEYWDGTSWASFNTMLTETTDSQYPHPKNYNWTTAGNFNVFFDCTIDTSWAMNDPVSLGANRYWVRFRVDGGSLSAPPAFEHIAIHTNHTKVESDGWISYRGKARPIARIPWDINMAQAAINSPGNQDLYIGDRLAAGRIENRFQTGARDTSGWNCYLPLDIDTSCPIVLRWSWVESVSNTGTIQWVIRWGYTKDGDGVFLSTSQAPSIAATEQQINYTINGSGVRRTQRTAGIALDISDMVARRQIGNGDLLWVSLERRGDQDTFTGDVSIINLSPYYTKWCEGGHL